MTYRSLTKLLANFQAANGAFKCRVSFRHHEEADGNGFATALVLRHLRRLPDQTEEDGVQGRALDFLERCASPRLPGAFGFWPPDERPAWAWSVPEDIDDTAIINQELAVYGRRTLSEVHRVVYEVLMPTLLPEVDPLGPPWIHPLVFPTWLGQDPHNSNPVDCCVNVNVAALMSWCGLTHLPGYREACALLDSGLDWARDNFLRLTSLTPYYPNPRELLYAMEHAVSSGAVALQSALERLRAILAQHAPRWRAQNPHLQGALCGNAYGGPYWYCSALEAVRDLAACLKPGQVTGEPTTPEKEFGSALTPANLSMRPSIHQRGG
jgi:hypothetical protein